MSQILDMNGKPTNQIDPMRFPIEQLIELQNKNGGKGTGLKANDLLTVIIFELSRTKNFALQQAAENAHLKEILREQGIRTGSEEQQNANDQDRTTDQTNRADGSSNRNEVN